MVPAHRVPAGAQVVGVVVLLPPGTTGTTAVPAGTGGAAGAPDTERWSAVGHQGLAELPPRVPGSVATRPRLRPAGAPSAAVPVPMAAQAVGSAGLAVDPDARLVHVDGDPVRLTRREFDLLEHLASRPGRVLTRTHLLQAVWEHADPRFAGPRTVDVHVLRLRRKLGPVHAAALQTVRGIGYRWVP